MPAAGEVVGVDAQGGYVASLTEAVMGVTSALTKIGNSGDLDVRLWTSLPLNVSIERDDT